MKVINRSSTFPACEAALRSYRDTPSFIALTIDFIGFAMVKTLTEPDIKIKERKVLFHRGKKLHKITLLHRLLCNV